MLVSENENEIDKKVKESIKKPLLDFKSIINIEITNEEFVIIGIKRKELIYSI